MVFIFAIVVTIFCGGVVVMSNQAQVPNLRILQARVIHLSSQIKIKNDLERS
jgi:hypothetical protein